MSSIKSFSEIGIGKVLSSDWLYPSNAQLRPIEAKSSIQESIGNDNEIFNYEDITSNWHYYGKPLRCVVRSICFLAVGCIIAPMGVVYHGCFFVKETVIYLTANQADSAESWKKVKDHASFFFVDLMITCSSYLALAFLVITGRSLKGDLAYLSKDEIYCSLFSTFLLASIGANPKNLVPYLAYKEDRAPLYKTISLRNDFGITALDGSLLPYNSNVDQETLALKGHFAVLMQAQALDLLYAINDIQSLLPDGSKIGAHFPPDIETIISHLQKVAWVKGEDYSAEVVNLRKLDANMKKMSALLKECLTLKKNVAGGTKVEITMPDFPFNKSIVKKFFYEMEFEGMDTPKAMWGRALEQGVNELKSCKYFIQASERYKKVRENITAKLKPHEILGCPANPTLAELRKKYKELTLLFHPDRVPVEFQKEAECIFKCVGTAYDLLNKELEKKKISRKAPE